MSQDFFSLIESLRANLHLQFAFVVVARSSEMKGELQISKIHLFCVFENLSTVKRFIIFLVLNWIISYQCCLSSIKYTQTGLRVLVTVHIDF